jgi:hypothetical protein|tara:strand:- start:169 stop:405 length:237 start_codon:yes stop_codon:yes gene_type:complete
MARETKRHSGATRDEVKVVAGVNINYDPYVQLEFYSYRIKALEESLETHKFLLAMHGGDLDEENATASIFINAVQEGL